MAEDYLGNLAAVLGDDMNQLPQAFYTTSVQTGAIRPETVLPQQNNPAYANFFSSQQGQYLTAILGGTYQPSIGAMTSPTQITTGEASPGGLYGGDVTVDTGTSAYQSINPNAYLGDKKHGASNLAAAVQRAQYADYLSRFAPIENFAVNSLTNGGKNTVDLQYDLNRAKSSAVNAGLNMQGQQERAVGRYGLQYKGPNIAESKETTGSAVAAMNQARLADEARALSLVGGSAKQGG